MGPHLRGGPNAPDLSKFHGMSASIRDEAISASIRDDTYTRANSTVLLRSTDLGYAQRVRKSAHRARTRRRHGSPDASASPPGLG